MLPLGVTRDAQTILSLGRRASRPRCEGGLARHSVAEVVASSGKGCALRRLGHPDRYLGMGIPEDLMRLGGFDEDAVFQAICELMKVAPTRDDDWATP